MKVAFEFKPSITEMYPQFIITPSKWICIPYIHPNKFGAPKVKSFPILLILSTLSDGNELNYMYFLTTKGHITQASLPPNTIFPYNQHATFAFHSNPFQVT